MYAPSGTAPAAGATPPVPQLRPLGVAEILDGAVRAVRRDARTAFTITAPFAIARAVLTALVALATYDTSGATQWQGLGRIVISGVCAVLLSGLLAPVFTGAMIGRRLTARQSLEQVGRAGVALVLLALLVTLAEGAGLIALVVSGVWLWGIWAVAAQALVIERTGLRGALRRSFELVRTEFWRTWGIRALGWVLVSALALAITLPFAALAAAISGTDLSTLTTTGVQDPNVYVLIIALGTLLSVLFTSPISAAIDALLYVDLRMRREGMDIVLGLPAVHPAGYSSDGDPPPAVTAW